jgi:FKBP-type peptidyl-prolyl cis-trans isomerase (trigger factor)
MMKIGDEATLAAFSENLRGASPDETREFDIVYPEDYDRRHWQAHRPLQSKSRPSAARNSRS